MRLNRDTRSQLFVDMTLDLDPTGSTVAVKVDGTSHPATWQGSPVQAGGKWTQTALTVDYFAGPDVTAINGATVLAAGRHATETVVTSGGTIIAEESTPIDVS